MRFDFWRPCYFYRVKPTKGRKVNGGHGSYLVNWRSLASMLRCLMHILVSAEPMSLVAPGNTKKARFIGWNTHTHTHTHRHTVLSNQMLPKRLTTHLPKKPHKAVMNIYITALSELCKVKALCSSNRWTSTKLLYPFTMSQYLHKRLICLS